MNVNGIKMCISCMCPLDDVTGECTHCGYIQSEYKQIPCCLSPGTVLSGRYVIGKVLGEGSFGITYIGWDTLLECVVAVKEFFPLEIVSRDIISGNKNVYLFSTDNQEEYKEKLDKFLNEARCLTKFNHLTGVVSVRDFFYENETAYMVMEYVSGCSLKEYIQRNGKMDGKEVISLMRPVLKALEEIHKSGIVHRDISPDNILFSENGDLVLIDFGSSRLREIDMMRSMTITFKRGFSPEEQYRSRGVLGAWTDVYSICATIYYMLTGEIPIESVERVIGGRLQSLTEKNDVNISLKQKKAVMKGLSVEAKDRYQTISQLYAELCSEEEVVRVIRKPRKIKKLYAGIAGILLFAVILFAIKILNNKNNAVTGISGTVTPAIMQSEAISPTPETMLQPTTSLQPATAAPQPTVTPTPEPIIYKMISVVGMKENKAKEKLKDIGSVSLKIKVKRIYDSEVEKDFVIKQSIKKGKQWSENEKKTITLYVSKGKKPQVTNNNSSNVTTNNNSNANTKPDTKPDKKTADEDDEIIGTIP